MLRPRTPYSSSDVLTEPYFAPAAEPAGGGNQPVDWWRLVQRGKWLMLLATVAGGYAGYLLLGVTPPDFESKSQVFLEKLSHNVPMNPESAGGEGLDDTRTEVETQVARLRSPRIIEQAVKKHRLAKLKTLANERNIVQTIVDGLKTKYQAGTRGILELRYICPAPDDSRVILSAIIDAYGDMLRDSQRSYHSDTLRLLTNAKDEILQKLNQKEQEYHEFRLKAPPIWSGEDKANIHRQRLVEIEAVRSELMIERSQLQSDLQSLEQAVQAGVSREALALMIFKDRERSDDAARSAELRQQSRQLSQQLIPLLIEENQMLRDYGADHPRVKEIRAKIAFSKDILTKANAEDVPLPKSDLIDVYLESLRQKIKATVKKETQFNQLYAAERDEAKRTLKTEYQDETFRDEIARMKLLFDAVIKRVGEIDLSRDFGGYSLNVITEPGHGTQVAPRPPLYLGFGAAAGCLAGLVLTFGRDKLRPGFRSIHEVVQLLQTPIAGRIPDVTRRPSKTRKLAGADPTLWAVQEPLSEYAEAVRGVRIALYYSSAGDDHRVIQITSPSRRQGATTLAANLAVTIANSGKRVLLVETDFREPRLHKLFNLANEVGTTSVIRGEAELEQACQPSGVPLLDCLTSGSIPENASELLSSEKFDRFLEVARERYEFVILDTPPVSLVTDTRSIASRVDGVFLTLTLDRTSREAAAQSVELLRSVDAKLLGIIVNRVRRQDLLNAEE